MPIAAWALVGLAAAKVLWLIPAILIGSARPDLHLRDLAFGLVPTALLALLLGLVGLFLIWGSDRDTRGRWLGGVLLLAAAPFADGVLARRHLTGFEPQLSVALTLDAFLPVFWWSFLRDFPQTPSPVGLRLASVFRTVSLWIGLGVFAVNLLAATGTAASLLPHAVLLPMRTRPAYWVLVLGLGLLGLPFLLWRTHHAAPDERRRVRVFIAGLLLGGAPIAVEILLGSLVPAYTRFLQQHPDVFSALGMVMYTTLAILPLVTAYAVFVDRIIGMRVVLRAAAQYVLARYTLLLLVATPFLMVAAYAFRHRDEPLVNLLSGPRLVLSASLVGLGLLALRERRRWLHALDRRFFRDQYDIPDVVADLVAHARSASNASTLSGLVRQDLTSALRLEHATLLVADRDSGSLIDPEERVRPLRLNSALVLLLAGDTAPLDVGASSADASLARLPHDERRWLADGGFELLVAVGPSPSSLAGLVALGPKRSGLAFSHSDRRVLTAVAASVALALDNQRLRSSPTIVEDEPAEECPSCGRVCSPSTPACACGKGLVRAPVPHLLRGAFRIDQRLGAGGMGVVYRALDLELGRVVAVKTLPRVSTDQAVRLRQEAQAMARLAHANLATIFGFETWRGTPLLVVELLSGGTLADLLKTGPLSVGRILEVGLALTGALEHIHRAGMVHCDVKPSNVGFTRDGTLKLLDFGLAQILSTPYEPLALDATMLSLLETASGPARPDLTVSWRVQGRFAGTPLYMAPEAIQGHRPDPRFDLWSAAVVLYEAAAGRHPFAGGSASEVFGRIVRGECLGTDELRARVPPELCGLLRDALSSNRRARPVTAAAFHERLGTLRMADLSQ